MLADPVMWGLVFLTLLAPIVLIVVIWRRQPLASPYFSDLFVLALSPIVFTSILTIMSLHHLIEDEDLSPGYVLERLRDFQCVACFGVAWSGFVIVLYSAFYFRMRRKAPGVEGVQVLP